MKQKRVFKKGWIVLFYALSWTLLFISQAVPQESGTIVAGQVQNAIPPDAAEKLAAMGIQACVPQPSIEPPPQLPLLADEGVVPGNVFGAPEQLPRPCPEGFVPQPIGKHGPKGRPRPHAGVETAVVPPQPGPGATDFYYAAGYQFVVRAGSYAFLTQHYPLLIWWQPWNEYHSLAEIAVESAPDQFGRRDIVEVGWNVDHTIYGNADPHLFVYHWVGGQETCYNGGCGWVQYSQTLYPGMFISYNGSAYQYVIFHWQGNWWVAYQGQWIGYFPDTLWNGRFTQSDLIQWFGEVAVPQGTNPPLSSMGNYYLGTSGNPNTARIYQTALYDENMGVTAASPALYWTNYNWYNTQRDSQFFNWFWYGGHGGSP